MFRIKATPDEGETYEFVAKSRDVVVWEKTGKNRSLGMLQEQRRFTDIYSLAHVAARRLGLFTGSLEEFEKAVDLEVLPEEEPDPTQSAR
jgi:hypothetical protein